MSLIETYMPKWSMRQTDRIAVSARPERAWEVVRGVDLYRIGLVRALFGLRTVPDRLRARLHGRPAPLPRRSRIDDIAKESPGFQVLGDEGHEVVVGSIGKFWQPTITFATVPAAEFAAFAEPGFGKLAWCLRVDPRAAGGSWITVDLRVDATDPGALARFRRYWLLIGRFSHWIRHALLAVLTEELGAAEPVETAAQPGDGLLPDARFQATHAVVIEAPPAKLWPWLRQMGGGRAGWYSYDRLDNGGVPSATRIVPELQKLATGDLIPGRPGEAGGFAVLQLEEERLLILGDPALAPGGRRQGGPPWRTTWTFALEPIGADATRLVVRVRGDYEPGVKMAVMAPVMRTLHEVMERRQLRNLRRRAEAS
jgi:proline iminopeptidase